MKKLLWFYQHETEWVDSGGKRDMSSHYGILWLKRKKEKVFPFSFYTTLFNTTALENPWKIRHHRESTTGK